MVDKDKNTFEGNSEDHWISHPMNPLLFVLDHLLDVKSFAKSDNFGHFGPEDGIHSFIHSAHVTEHLLCVTTRLGTWIYKATSWLLQSVMETVKSIDCAFTALAEVFTGAL